MALEYGAHQLESGFGTFADSKKAPIHRWFQYPAGFSWKAVDYVLDMYRTRPGTTVYDPFMGTGTTLVVCKVRGCPSWGVEAHPFVWQVAAAKLHWDYDYARLRKVAEATVERARRLAPLRDSADPIPVPELVRKCFSPLNLRRLVWLRDDVESEVPSEFRGLFLVALACALRRASKAATGWPYIAPKKEIAERDGVESFAEQIRMMLDDLSLAAASGTSNAPAYPILGDSRNSEFPEGAFDLAFTSPPYLNNYDYADRTRLETYFLGQARSWREITEKVRSRLIVSATTQINRNDYDPHNLFSDDLREAAPTVYRELGEKVALLSRVRREKGGKKSYDIMVAQYFNDMTGVFRDCLRCLRKGAPFVLILGDSAPYGVYIPTHEYLGQIALGLGFRDYQIDALRPRGGKWPGNPQRHHVPLSEVVLTIVR